MSNILKVYSLFISIIIGAGFASGKEVFTFFVLLKESSLLTLITSSIVFFLGIYSTLEITRKQKTTTYNQFLNFIFENKIIISFFEICIIFFMFVSFSSMIAGFASITSQSFNITTTLARILFLALNFILLTKGYTYIIKLSVFLVPLFIICALLFAKSYLINPTKLDYFNTTLYSSKVLFNGLTYSSYNLITAIAMVCTLPHMLKSKRNNLCIAILVTFSLMIITISIILPLQANFEFVKNTDMPIYTVLLRENSPYLKTYILIMILATLSTSIANAYTTTEYISNKFKLNYYYSLSLILTSGIIFSLIGFSNIVNFIYPIFGFFGIIKIVKIIIAFL